MMQTERINIQSFEMKYLNNYFNEFNVKIIKHQWPNLFESIEDAMESIRESSNKMDRDETLLFSILSKNEFLGNVDTCLLFID